MLTTDQIRYLTVLLDKFRALGLRAATRTQIHKISFFVQYETGGDVPFDFVLHRYGPYSFDLDEAIQDMVSSGSIAVEYDPAGYGAEYSLPEGNRDQEEEELPEAMDHALGRWVNDLGQLGVKELELKATALYVAQEKESEHRDQQVAMVRQIKPHFSEQQVAHTFAWLERKDML